MTTLSRCLLSAAVWLCALSADAACLDDALELLGGEVRSRHTFFSSPGEVRSQQLVLDAPRCLTVLATATNPAASVDGVMRTQSGLDLSADGPNTRHAVLRFCGAAGVTLAWTLQVSAASEVRVAVIDGAPTQLPDWGRELGGCFAGAPGLRSSRPEMGAPPPGIDADGRVAIRLAEAQARGYTLESRTTLDIEPDATGQQTVRFDGERCYTLWAVPEVGAVDMVIAGPDGAEVIGDHRRAVDAGVAYCPIMSGEFTVIVHDGGGARSAEVVVLSQVAGDVPQGLTGPARRSWVELVASRGPMQKIMWMHLRAGEAIQRQSDLGPGCHVLAAVAAPESVNARFELQLLDQEGRLLANAFPMDGAAVVQHCGGGSHRLRVRMLRGAGRIMLARGTR